MDLHTSNLTTNTTTSPPTVTTTTGSIHGEERSRFLQPAMIATNPYQNVQSSEYLGSVHENRAMLKELYWPSPRPRVQQPIFRWPPSITKAARYKRWIARKMISGSSSSLSLSLYPPAPASQGQARSATVRTDDSKTIIPSDNKRLRFLFQKELTRSDVAPVGRIVLPKREAEAYLPPLTTNEGIQIPITDFSTSKIWRMRYRFWTNNKSRMYILENTRNFVMQHGLEVGDLVKIYEELESKMLYIFGKKVEPRPRVKPLQLQHQEQQQQQQQLLLLQQHYQQLLQQQYQQRMQKPLYYILQTQNNRSRIVEEFPSSNATGAVPSTLKTATSLSNIVVIDTPAASRQLSLYNDTNINVRQGVKQESMGASSSHYGEDGDDNVYIKLEKLMQYGSL